MELVTVHSTRAKVNSGDHRYRVTAVQPPAFLYENPDDYDPENVLRGFMRGYFLVRVCKYFDYCIHILMPS